MLIGLKDILLVGAGGFAGSVCRYAMSVWIMAWAGTHSFPMATFTVNAAGSLLIGMLMAATGGNSLHLVLITGFCGGFTTFSTFSAETLALLKTGQFWTGAVYALASVVVCVMMVMLGMALTARLKGL